MINITFKDHNLITLIIFVLVIVSVNSHAEFQLKTETSDIEYLGKPQKIITIMKCELDDIETNYTWEYDREGRLIEIKDSNDGQGKKFSYLSPESMIKYSYEGNEISTFDLNTKPELGPDQIFSMKVLKRDSHNRPILSKSELEMIPKKKRDLIDLNSQVEQSVSDWMNGTKKALHSYKYVDNLIIETQSTRGPFGETIVFKKVFDFRDDGREISEIVEDPITKRLSVVSENIYENGLLITEKKSLSRIENEYFENNLLKKKIIFNGLDLFVVSYEYEYLKFDKAGNWRESVVTVVDSTHLLNEKMRALGKNRDVEDKKSICPSVRITREFYYF